MTPRPRQWKKSALRAASVGAVASMALAGVGYYWASARLAGPIDVGAMAEAAPGDIVHGRELATQTLICTECHAQDLGGAVVVEGAPGLIAAHNLTRRRSFAEWDRAIRHGVAADGRPLVMMPSDGYSRLSVSDLRDLVAYLDQLPTVDRDVPPTHVSPLGTVLAATGALHVPALTIDHGAVAEMEETTRAASDPIARGTYLLDVSGCRGCHGQRFEGRSMGPDLPAAPALSADIVRSRGHESFLTALTQGRRHDGAPLHSVMPWRAYSTWPRADLDAVWRALVESEAR